MRVVSGAGRSEDNLFRDHDFRLFWAAEAVSQLGSMVTVVALPLVAVTTLQASVFAVGLLTAAAHLAWLLIGLPTGVWVDRVRRRPVLICADLGRAVLLASIPAAAALGALSFPHLLIVALLTSALTVLFDVGYQAYLPSIVRRGQLIQGNAKLSAVHSVTHVGAVVVGPLGRRVGDARLVWLSLAVSTPFGLLVPLATRGAGLGWFVAGTLALGAGVASYGVGVASFVQTLTPSGLLARATASVRVVSRGALPVGALAGGALAQALGTRAALAIVLGCSVLAPVWLLLSPVARARDLDELGPLPGDSPEHGAASNA